MGNLKLGRSLAGGGVGEEIGEKEVGEGQEKRYGYEEDLGRDYR